MLPSIDILHVRSSMQSFGVESGYPRDSTDILFPIGLHIGHVTVGVYPKTRHSRFDRQRHSSQIRHPVAFFLVAVAAGRDHVFPGVASAFGARNHMVQREFMLAAAILAGIKIAAHHIAPRKRNWVNPGATNISFEANNTGNRHGGTG